MAAAAPPFLLLLLPIFFTLLTHSSSRSLPPPDTHTFLDVSASLSQALHFLSPQSHHQPQQQQASLVSQSTFHHFNASSSFSLDLLSRESIFTSDHQDYKSLVLSRLRRDSARVQSLSAKLLLKSSSSDGDDDDQFLPQATDLSTPIISGSKQGSGEYFSRIGVGTPPRPFYMVLDTGSDVNWLQCDPCADCYTQTDPIFNPSSSSSYSPLTCESPLCSSLELSSCRAPSQCLYQVNYGDGSFTTGDFVTETVSFGSNSGSVSQIALGCGHDNEGLFIGAAGLLGLGGGPLSLTSQLKATSFSYCLVNRDSLATSSLDFNSAFPGDSVTANLIKSRKIDTFYYVGLTGISVGGRLLSIPAGTFAVDESGNGGIIVDCGTAITRLQTQAYSSLRDAFVSLTPNLRRTSGVALFDTCYDMSGMASVKVPTVSFHFAGGKTWNLPAANYLIPVDGEGTFCFAFAPTTSSLSIIGNVQQQGTRVSFDLVNNRVGFSTNKC
ncbi:Protein ASPARTIC PROTEASE IN GUARD CELL 1 [Linum grandiflorum]